MSLEHHQIAELAFAVGDQPVTGAPVPHTLEGADPKSLEVNRYFERNLGDVSPWDFAVTEQFMRAAAGNILVGANPAFDAYRIEKLMRFSSWHYRLGDVESVAWLMLGFDEPPGLRQIRDRLNQLGFALPEPDHSAAGDVEVVRAVFRVLQRIARYLLAEGLPTAQMLERFDQVLQRHEGDAPDPVPARIDG